MTLGSQAPSTLSVGDPAASGGCGEGGCPGKSLPLPYPSPVSPTSAPDIRLDWETYAPEDRADRLLELLVFYGPPSPPRDQAGSDRLRPEAPESSSSFWSPSPSDVSKSSREAAQPVSRGGRRAAGLWPVGLEPA